MRHFKVFLALFVAYAQASESVLNNELYPRDSPMGKLQVNIMESEGVVPEELDDRQLLSPLLSRQNGFALFNRNPFLAIGNRLPVIRNPEYTGVLQRFDSCTAPDGESGICLGSAGCTLLGGRASGSCVLGSVCCINVVSKCSGIVTMNNTYWQTPANGIAPSSTCSMSVRVDQNLPEQKKQPICQIRLDFVSFSISQPLTEPAASVGQCGTDNFQVSGGSSRTPVICGDNDGQHMYVTVPSSDTQASDVQLTFTFGAGVATRTWNIKIAMIPCAASYAAPSGCLQYFTGASGTVKTFNWKDVPVAVRQLANQDYNVCFRSELVNGQRANGICYQICTVKNTGAGFSMSGDATADAAAAATPANCAEDFVVVMGGINGAGDVNDRICGTAFSSTDTDTANVQVCSSVRSFKLYVKTDATDPDTDVSNMGFCLNYMQRVE